MRHRAGSAARGPDHALDGAPQGLHIGDQPTLGKTYPPVQPRPGEPVQRRHDKVLIRPERARLRDIPAGRRTGGNEPVEGGLAGILNHGGVAMTEDFQAAHADAAGNANGVPVDAGSQ